MSAPVWLPCPFCGGEADPVGWIANNGIAGPACDDCGATAENIEAWNRRATDGQTHSCPLCDQRAEEEKAVASITARTYVKISVNSEMLIEVRTLLSTLTDPNAYTPNRADVARELLPRFDQYLNSAMVPDISGWKLVPVEQIHPIDIDNERQFVESWGCMTGGVKSIFSMAEAYQRIMLEAAPEYGGEGC